MSARLLQPKQPFRRHALLEIFLVLDLILIGLFAVAALVAWSDSKITPDEITHDYFGSEMDAALLAYKVNTGNFPTTQQGLQALVAQPGGVSGWHGPYLTIKTVPLDPWGHPYHYAFPSTHGQPAAKYDCWSLGPDGVDGTKDDVGNWPTTN